MNIVRKLLSSSSAGSSTDIPNVEGETSDHMADHLTRQETTIKTPEQELLGLSHLKKLHLDYNSNSILRDVRSYAANQASIDHYVHHKTLEYVLCLSFRNVVHTGSDDLSTCTFMQTMMIFITRDFLR